MSNKKPSKKTGKAAGGFARAQRLSKEELSSSAKRAALARWNKDVPKVEWEGDLEIGDISFKCGIIEKEDGSISRVISETELMKALGMYRSGALSVRREVGDSGARIPLCLAYKNLEPFIMNNLGGVHIEPKKVVFKGGLIGHGIDAELLLSICEVWIDAAKSITLGSRQVKIAAAAEALHRGLARVGIAALIDEVTGYQQVRGKRALQSILDKYLTDHARKWSKTFPDEFWDKLLKTKGYESYIGLKRPQFVGHWVNDLVYDRLAPGIRTKLQEKNPRKQGGNRKHKHHQLLTEDHGVPELRNHLVKLITLMDAAGYNKKDFEKMIKKALPKFGTTIEMDLDV